MTLPRCSRLVALAALLLGAWPRASHAQPDGPVALVVNSDDPAFSWERVQRTMLEALETAVVATDDPTAKSRRGLLTVSWRPSRRELAVTYEDARGTIGRIVPAPDDVAAGVAAAGYLAVNLARDQVSDLLAPPPPPTEDAKDEPSLPPPSRLMMVAAPAAPPPAPPRPLRRWSVALLGGVGVGYASGFGDVSADAQVSPGLAPAGTVHFQPEVGFLVTPRLLLSLSARLELVTGTTDRQLSMSDPQHATECGGNYVCEAKHNGFAAFARATYFTSDQSHDLRPYVSIALGGGEIAYRVTFPSIPFCGPSGKDPCVDTTSSGPVMGGPGGGVHYRVADALDLVAGLEILLGGPRTTFNADANLGAAVLF
jgi:hypothetical protein